MYNFSIFKMKFTSSTVLFLCAHETWAPKKGIRADILFYHNGFTLVVLSDHNSMENQWTLIPKFCSAMIQLF